MPSILVFDLGTTGLKTVLFSERFDVIASADATYETHRPASDLAEQAPADWWGALVATTREVLAAHPGAAGDIAGIALSGHMMGCIPLDGAGNILMERVPIWLDRRGIAQCEALLEKLGGFEAFYHISRQGMQTELYSLAKIMWVRDTQPDLFAKARWFVNAKDWLGFRMTGRVATDPSEAACTIAYDVTTREMSPEILGAAGLSADFMPEILEPGALIGTLNAEAASALGLPETVPVYMGLGDAVAAAAGALACQPGDAYFSFGTAMWGGMISAVPEGDVDDRTNVLPFVQPGLYQLQYVVNTGMLAHEWAVETFYGGREFARAEADARAVPRDSANLLFLPTLNGSGAPFNCPDARGVFFGMSPRHGRGHFIRATLEGLAMSVALVRDNLEALGKVRIGRLGVIGGGTASELFLQILADTLQCEVEVGAFEKDCTAFGAAICAAMGAGWINGPTEVRGMVPEGRLYRPDPALAEEVAVRRALYADLFARVRPSFDDLASFRRRGT
ncbi:MAG: xylulokinase [Tropicimonas sp.]|uniref:xylulokinase n=1 Tax=Tropicimonas sp. TaxID=2067044 RepID=UPI003A87C29C